MPHHTDEFERLMAQRDRLWQNTLRSLAESVVIHGQLPQDIPEPARTEQALGLGQLMQQAQEPERQPLREMRDTDDLIAAARFYNVPNPESTPEAELEAIVKARREMVADMGGVTTARDKVLGVTSSVLAQLPISAAQESLRFVGNIAARIPFMGDAIVRSETAREVDRWFTMLEEGLTADLPERQRTLAKGIAGAVGMFPGAILSWQALGLVGLAPKVAMIGGRISPIGRASIPNLVRAMARGAGTEFILQDPTAPLYEQGINAAAGAAFGLGDVGGALGRTVTGIGMGAIAGALAGEGANDVTAISAVLGGIVANVPGALSARVRKSFPSVALERSTQPWIPEAEWTTLDPLSEVGGPGQAAPLALPPGQIPMGGVVERGLEMPPVGGRVFAMPGEVAGPEPGMMGLEWIHPYSVAVEPGTEAINLTKQAAILESPALPVLNARAALDDSDVALALTETYPGQVGVVQNVGDVAQTIRRILMEQMPNGVGPQDFRVVERSTFGVGKLEGLPPLLLQRNPPVSELEILTDPSDVAHLAVRAFRMPEGEVITNAFEPYGFHRQLAVNRGLLENVSQSIAARRREGRLLEGVLPEAEPGWLTTERSFVGIGDLFSKKSSIEDIQLSKKQTDILVSSGRPISNQMVKDYETYGMFSGQRAVLPSGQEVTIERLGVEDSVVKSVYGGATSTVRTLDLLPQKSSHLVGDLPEVYGDFAAFAQQRLNEQTLDIGALPIPMMSNEGLTQVPLLMNEYLQSIGVNPEGYYGAALRTLMEQRHIEAIRELAPPEELMMLKQAQSQLAELEARNEPWEATVSELAEARGFTWQPEEPRIQHTGANKVPLTMNLQGEIVGGELAGQAPWLGNDPVTGAPSTLLPQLNEARIAEGLRPLNASGQLIDAMSDGAVRIPVANEDEAREFLHNFQREPIDDSPTGPIPLEVIEQTPNFSPNAGREPGVYISGQDWAARVHGLDEDLADLYARLGEDFFQTEGRPPAGGPPPEGPPPPRGPLPPPEDPFGFFPPRDPAATWNEAWKNARKTDVNYLRKAMAKMDGVVSQWFTPTRNMAIRFDALFKPLGIPPIERMVVELQNAHDRMVNLAHPWEQQAYNALEGARRKVIRDGTLWEILVVPREFRGGMMKRAGLTTEEKVAVDELDLLFGRFREEALRIYPELPENYLHMFQRIEEGLPGDRPRRPSQASWGPSKIHDSMEVAEKDLDAIIARYFRSFYKVQEMNAPYSALRDFSRAKAVPDAVKDWLGGWTEARMWGLDPSKDIMLNTTHSVLDNLAKLVGLRVSRNEVQGLFHAEMTASYAAGLGLRPDAIIRDMPQALIGIAHVGLDKGLPIFKKLISDKEFRDAAFELAYANGWLTRGHGLAVDPDLFGGTAFREINPDVPQSITQTRAATAAADFLRDRVLSPLGLRRGWQGTALDPLKAYGWQADWARLWNLTTGYMTAQDALRKFDAAKLYKRAPMEVLEQELLDNARVSRFQGTIQDGFLEFARRGDYEGAASYFARHVGDSQNRFGMTEHPAGFRRWGPVTGRKAMKWLTYNSQMMANFAQIIADPRISAGNKAAYFAQIGTLQAAYAGGQLLSGWNLMKLSMLGIAFGFAGTSIFDHVNSLQRGLALWERLNPTSNLDPIQNALIAVGGNTYGSRFFTANPVEATWNPWSGGMRTAQGLAETGPWGPEAIGRFFVTGERGDPWTTRLQQGQEELEPLQWYGRPVSGAGSQQ